MFPFHPKPPTLGKKLVSELKNKLPSGSGGKSDCKTYQLRNGGPVQRAIRDDMLSLKETFQDDFERNCRVLEENASSSSGASLSQHLALGSSYSIYKETFRKKKFGIIHSAELCPPRCDRDSYIQMIYSAALEFLYEEDLFGFEKEAEEGSVDDVAVYLPISIAFAVFTTFTLYHTNILPSIPTKDCTAMEDALSTLTMGLASDTVKYKMHRRTYKSPIRLSQDLYALLYQVRNLSLLCIDQCQQQKYRPDIKKSGHTWICSCSLARDCIHIIDKLEHEESFQLCEYSGPVSLEGLAGSREYYHEIVLQEDIPVIRQRYRDYSFGSSHEHDSHNTNDITTSFHMKSTELFDTYDSLLEKIAQKLNKNIASSKPLHLTKEVRSNLEPVFKQRRNRRQLKHDFEPDSKRDDNNTTNDQSTKESDLPNEANTCIEGRSFGNTSFQYAPHFSNGLRKGIMLALRELKKEKGLAPEDSSRSLNRATESQIPKDFDDWFLEGLYGESVDNTEQDFRDEHHMLDESSIISGEHQAEGIGLMHLRHLLNAAKNKRVRKKATISRKRATATRNSKYRKEISEDEFSDDYSFSSDSMRTTGAAGEMFQTLFHAIDDVQSKDENSDLDHKYDQNSSSVGVENSATVLKRRKSAKKYQSRGRKRKLGESNVTRNDDDASSDEGNSQTSDEESLKTTGPGANALDILLSKI